MFKNIYLFHFNLNPICILFKKCENYKITSSLNISYENPQKSRRIV